MKLSFKPYETKFQSVTFMFDLLRHALNELGTTRFKRFMQAQRKPKEASFKRLLGFLSADPAGSSLVAHATRYHKRKLSADLPITPSLKWAENKGDALLGLNASELVLRVALFEAFLKEIHRHALLAKPQLLAQVKPKRSVLLKDLFRAGFARTKSDEIHRQVREADRLRTKDRAKFFNVRLQLKWGDDASVERLTELVQLRHDLVHESPDKPVTPKDIDDSRKLFISIPRACFDKACAIYADQFEKR